MATAENPSINVRVEPDNTFPAMLRRLAARFTPATIIDVGASDGRWARMAHEIWPDANLLLIEANPKLYRQLLDFAHDDQVHRWPLEALVAGYFDTSQRVRFNEENPFQGAPMAGDGPGQWVKCTNIDLAVKTATKGYAILNAPYLIKLDVHGREHEILSGARETLKNTGAIVAEVYTWSQGWNSLRAMDLIPLIEREYGFLPSDLCEPMRRPFDGRLSQVDMLFEPKSAAGMDTARFK